MSQFYEDVVIEGIQDTSASSAFIGKSKESLDAVDFSVALD